MSGVIAGVTAGVSGAGVGAGVGVGGMTTTVELVDGAGVTMSCVAGAEGVVGGVTTTAALVVAAGVLGVFGAVAVSVLVDESVFVAPDFCPLSSDGAAVPRSTGCALWVCASCQHMLPTSAQRQ